MKILILMLFVSTTCLAQQKEGEIVYQYKNDAFPFDSGVSVSDRQYQFILRGQVYNVITEKAATPPPKIVIQTKEVRQKGDGNKIVWFLTGTTAGIVVTTIAVGLIKK